PIVTPDNTLRCWKDEDELEHAASLGVLDADEVRAEADRVVAAWPFRDRLGRLSPGPGMAAAAPPARLGARLRALSPRRGRRGPGSVSGSRRRTPRARADCAQRPPRP